MNGYLLLSDAEVLRVFMGVYESKSSGERASAGERGCFGAALTLNPLTREGFAEKVSARARLSLEKMFFCSRGSEARSGLAQTVGRKGYCVRARLKKRSAHPRSPRSPSDYPD